MEVKTLLNEQIERERLFLKSQEVGTDEYNDSMKRLCILEDKLLELKKFEVDSASKVQQLNDENKNNKVKNRIEIAKIVVGVITSFGGLALIEMYQKDDTFTGVMKGWLNVFMPKKI